MNEHQALVWKKLDHIDRMRGYLPYSAAQIQALHMPLAWNRLTPDEHESLAAFRVRFSDYREYEDDSVALQGLFQAMLASTPELLLWHERLLAFCAKTHPR